MIAVSDTGPLHYLVLIDAIDILPRRFRRVYIPTEVERELRKEGNTAKVTLSERERRTKSGASQG